MITALLPMELHKKTFSTNLIQGHIKGALPGDKNVLPVDFFIYFWNFKHEGRVKANMYVFGKIRKEQLFELRRGKRLDFKDA